MPEKIEVERAIIKPKYLDDNLVETPSLALDMVRLELGHLASIVNSMLEEIGEAFEKRDSQKFEEISKMDDQADILHAEITDYLRKLTVQNLTEQENDDLLRYLAANEDLERIGDVIETNMVNVGQQAIRLGIQETEAEREVLENLYVQVRQALGALQAVAVENDEVAAQNILHMKDDINRLVLEVLQLQAKRLKIEGADNIDVTHLENELIDSMKRIYSLTKRVAKLSLPDSLLQESA